MGLRCDSIFFSLSYPSHNQEAQSILIGGPISNLSPTVHELDPLHHTAQKQVPLYSMYSIEYASRLSAHDLHEGSSLHDDAA